MGHTQILTLHEEEMFIDDNIVTVTITAKTILSCIVP